MGSSVQKRIEHIRRQPERTRLRIAVSLTAVVGFALVLLWATVMLPAQLRFRTEMKEEPIVQEVGQRVEELRRLQQDREEPAVGGARDEQRVAPSYLRQQGALPASEPFATSTPTLSPTPSPDQQEDRTAPVEVTNEEEEIVDGE